MKKIFYRLYKAYHKRISKDQGMLCQKVGLVNGEFTIIGKEEIVYRSELKREIAALDHFNKFLDNVQKLPPWNHRFWHTKFTV